MYKQNLQEQKLTSGRAICNSAALHAAGSAAAATASHARKAQNKGANSRCHKGGHLSSLLGALLTLSLCWGFNSTALADTALQDLLQAQSARGSNEVLSAEDLKILQALSQAQNSKSRALSAKPIVTAPGEVRFIYGASQPTVVCSLLHVCDIALEPGESVVDLKVGDSARWLIERSASGSNDGIVEHITIKPTDVGLLSNMRIYTDRRTYALNLKSSASEFMPSVSFSYPQQSLQRFEQVKDLLKQSTQQYTTTVPSAQGNTLTLLSELDFNYELSGDEELYPLRVFNDGHKTYVQIPPNMLHGRLPALVAVTATHVFGADDTNLTNYRLHKNTFVVDGIPAHLRLILGNEQSATPLSSDIIYKTAQS